MTMEKVQSNKKAVIGNYIDLDSFMEVVRGKSHIDFSQDLEKRVKDSRDLVEKWVQEGRVMYGITTGFGANSTRTISQEDAEKLQKNIVAYD